MEPRSRLAARHLESISQTGDFDKPSRIRGSKPEDDDRGKVHAAFPDLIRQVAGNIAGGRDRFLNTLKKDT